MTSGVDTVEALRQATREAREALKDLRVEHRALRDTQRAVEQTRAAVRDMIAEWEQSIQDRVEKAIRAKVDGEMAVLGSEVTDAVRGARTQIYARFDRLGREVLETLGGGEAINSLQESLGRLQRGELTSVPTMTVIPLALKRNGAKST